MAKRKRTVGLIAFLKGSSDPAVGMPGCANYDRSYGGCLFCWRGCNCTNEECLPCVDFLPYTYCKVEQGQRCWCFEQAVLPTARDIGLTALVYSLYEKQVGMADDDKLDSEPIRKCPGTDKHECGAALRPRQRYCDKCAQKRRRQAYRKARRKKTG